MELVSKSVFVGLSTDAYLMLFFIVLYASIIAELEINWKWYSTFEDISTWVFRVKVET